MNDCRSLEKDQDLAGQLQAALERVEELEEENAETVTIFEQLKKLEKDYSELKSQKEKSPGEKHDAEKDKKIEALINGQADLRKIIENLETENLKLKTAAVDSGYNVELANQVAILQSHVTQRENQLKVAIRQNEELKVELQRMHQKAQESISDRVQDEALGQG